MKVSATLAPSVSFDLAQESDDASLRSVLRRTPMAGSVRVAFLREPSYFAGEAIQGPFVQTLVARRRGEIVGMATRAVRPTWLNGRAVDAGYLGDLRLVPEIRGGLTLAGGYRFLRQLHADGRVDVYSTVIVEDNDEALRSIAANRADLPRYIDQGRLFTPMLPLRRSRSVFPRARIIRGTPELLPAIVERLNREKHQFSPVYREEDFTGGRFPGFGVSSFRVLLRGTQIAGVCGVWDQRCFRQTVVTSYASPLRWIRPLLNLVARAGLPATEDPLRLFFMSFVATDDVPAFGSLLEHVLREHCGTGYTHCITGLHEENPRCAVLHQRPHIPFAGRMFAVTFDGSPSLDGRLPHMEAALL